MAWWRNQILKIMWNSFLITIIQTGQTENEQTNTQQSTFNDINLHCRIRTGWLLSSDTSITYSKHVIYSWYFISELNTYSEKAFCPSGNLWLRQATFACVYSPTPGTELFSESIFLCGFEQALLSKKFSPHWIAHRV